MDLGQITQQAKETSQTLDDIRRRIVNVRVADAFHKFPALQEKLRHCADDITAIIQEAMSLPDHPATNAEMLNYFRDAVGQESFNALAENPNIVVMVHDYYKGRVTLALNQVSQTLHSWFVEAGSDLSLADVADMLSDQMQIAIKSGSLPDREGFADIGLIVNQIASIPAKSISTVFEGADISDLLASYAAADDLATHGWIMDCNVPTDAVAERVLDSQIEQ